MLQIIREKAQGLIAWTIISLIIITFALWGIDNFRSNNGGSVAARVNGQKISWNQVEAIYQHYYNSLARANPQMLQNMDSRLLREQVRQMLVGQAAFKTQVLGLGYAVSEQQVMNKIMTDPSFQDEGKFSADKYKQALAQFGHTTEAFEDNIRTGLLAEQTQVGLAASSFALQSEVDQMMALWTQTRNFGFVLIPATHFYKEITISDQQVEDYYKQHQQLFIAPEKIKIAYVSLDLDDLVAGVTVTDEQLQQHYDSHQALYTDPEGVNVRHIFINAPAGSDLAIGGEARAKINDLLAQIKLGADFVTIAKKYSEDPGSAANGGELGLKGRGETVAEFENVAFALKQPGDISEVVQSEFGFHIIQLIKHQESKLRPYSEVKDQVARNYRREVAEANFEAKGEELANLAFENTDSLEPAANALGLKVQQSDFFAATGGEGLTAEPVIVEAAFNEELLNNARNSELLKLDEEHYVVLRVIERKPAEQQPLAAVKADIEAKLEQTAAVERAEKFGKELLQALKNGEPPHKIVGAKKLDWVSYEGIERTSAKINPEILSHAFALAKPKVGNSNVGFALTNGDYVVISLSKVASETAEAGNEVFKLKKARLAEQLEKQISRIETQIFQGAVIKQADVKLEKLP